MIPSFIFEIKPGWLPSLIKVEWNMKNDGGKSRIRNKVKLAFIDNPGRIEPMLRYIQDIFEELV